MQEYRKKEPTVKAVQFLDRPDAEDLVQLSRMFSNEEFISVTYEDRENPIVRMPYGLTAKKGDYIIADSNGRFAVMNATLVEGTYESVNR